MHYNADTSLSANSICHLSTLDVRFSFSTPPADAHGGIVTGYESGSIPESLSSNGRIHQQAGITRSHYP